MPERVAHKELEVSSLCTIYNAAQERAERSDASGPRLTHADIAKCLGTKTNYTNNKMTRNSFSVEDIVRIAKRAGYTVGIFKDGTNTGVTLGFNPETKRLTIERSTKEET